MTGERSRQIERLYHDARERDPRERVAFLDQACAGDSALRRDVESLLAEDARVQSFLETPALELARKMSGEDASQSMIGRQFGPYSVLSLLAKGGMGEVYSARDTRLGRDVAVKVLPPAFARDAERLTRFQREARLLASLNHPNVAAIYGMEESGGLHCLVMELVPGETLANAGSLPLVKALTICRQIAEGLEEAHRKNITHRDIKPANIKVTPAGAVKILDFGLAKGQAGGSSEIDLSELPQASTVATEDGRILGTPGYMSPEQVRGQTVDKQTDIWAFGCVLYELLTGVHAFQRESLTDTIAAVLEREPDWQALPPATPAAVRHLLRRCLQKDKDRRLRDIGDARIEIEEALAGSTPAAEPSMAVSSTKRGWLGWSIALVLAAALAAISVLSFNRVPPAEIRVDINTPSTADPFSFAISPDGRRLVFSASNEGKSQLWVRPLDSLAAQPLAGTDGATYPFWSPDSASVGFFASGKLKRIDIVGGAPQVLTDAPTGQGGAWNREGTILFNSEATGPLFKVPETGGEAVAITRLETGQASHRFPQFLPDGRHFIYFARAGPSQGVYVGSLDGGSTKRLGDADAAAVVSPLGFLLFLRQTNLLAQVFDFKRQELSGNPFPVAEHVVFSTLNATGFSAASGIVAYRTGSAGGARQLTWLDRSGKSVGTIGAPDTADLRDVELSPDEKRVAAFRTVSGNTDVWLIDAARGVPTRFTFDAAADWRPIWSADGSRLVFGSNRKGTFNLYWKSSSGAGADELLVESDQNKMANNWSSDGRFLLFRGDELSVLPVSGDKKPFPFLKTSTREERGEFGQFSFDGKWIAYQSYESGRPEIYVQPFPGPGGKSQISSNGGAQPRWNKNGKEIFYVSLDSKMMAAPVKLSPDGQSLETGTPMALFPVRIAGGPVPGFNKQQYAVSSDGQRFLVNLAADEGAASPITLILNWSPEHRK
jgi:eukaryotic-like serine/threonine-protein kinase